MEQDAVGDGAVVLALDIGGTKTTAALVRDAAVLTTHTVPTPAEQGPVAILDAAAAAGRSVLDAGSVPGAVVAGGPVVVGVATAGVVDRITGGITHATDSLTGWAGTAVRDELAERFALPVCVLNDVHAHGLGEAEFGVGQGHRSMLLVAVGTGIGGAFVVDGRVWGGAHGVAGHVGHVTVGSDLAEVRCSCGRLGHLEGVASGPGIVRMARRLGVAVHDGPALAQAARAGVTAAREAYRIAGEHTGRAIGDLLNVLDPDVVALTGGVVGVNDAWESALHAGIAASALDAVATTPVLPARAGVRAALLGAASAARKQYRGRE